MILNKTNYVNRTLSILFLSVLFFSFTPKTEAQELISSELIESRSLAQMQANINAFMQNGVDLYKITYSTLDVFGQLDTASGLLVLPVREETFIYPLLCYQHGTVAGPLDVPSNLQGGSYLAILYGGMGYVTVAADYLGLGESRGFHPYVHAKTEASAAIDLLFAAKQYTATNDILLNDQLFITGYSQGGHAAMALQREIQENYGNDFTITASAPMSGPYDIGGAMLASMLSEAVYYTPAYMPYTTLSYNMAYDIGYSVNGYFKEPYAAKIQQFFDGDIGLWSLNDQLINLLDNNVGAIIPKRMLQDSIIEIALNQPSHPLRLAMLDNSLIDWVPQAPTRLYYCTADDQVSYLNSEYAGSVMNMNGAPDLMAIDVDPTQDHGGCVSPAVTQTLFFFASYQDLTVDNEDILLKETVTIFPNPAKESVELINVPAGAIVELFDIEGKLRLQETTKDNITNLSINDLSNGLYWLRISNGNEILNRKLVIAK